MQVRNINNKIRMKLSRELSTQWKRRKLSRKIQKCGEGIGLFFRWYFWNKKQTAWGRGCGASPPDRKRKIIRGENSMKRVFVKAVLMLLVLALPAVAW